MRKDNGGQWKAPVVGQTCNALLYSHIFLCQADYINNDISNGVPGP